MTCPNGRTVEACPVCGHTSHLPDNLETAFMRQGLHRLIAAVAADTEPMVIGEVPALDRDTWRARREPAPPSWVNEAWELEVDLRRRPSAEDLNDEDLEAWLERCWVGDERPTVEDLEMIRNYRANQTRNEDPLTWPQLVELAVWFSVSAGLFVLALLAFRWGFRTH